MIVVNLRLDTETQERRRRLEALYETKLPPLLEKIFRHFEERVLSRLNEQQQVAYFEKRLTKAECGRIIQGEHVA
jgi:hypothetical protein